jgi:hypothetical protein
MPVVPSNLGQDLGAVIDATNGVRQSLSGAESRGRGTERSRHQGERRIEPQERDAQKARANGSLHDRSFGQAAAAIRSSRQHHRS